MFGIMDKFAGKVFACIVCMLGLNALALEVSTFDDFKSALADVNVDNIKLSNDIIISSSLSNIENSNLIIDGNSNLINHNGHRGFFIQSDANLALSNLTFATDEGSSFSIYEEVLDGFAMSNQGTVSISNVSFDNISYVNNYVPMAIQGEVSGGIIFNNGTISSIKNSTLNNNNTSGYYLHGGIILNNGTINEINNVEFKNNESESRESDNNGVVIANNGKIDLIINSVFDNNKPNLSDNNHANGVIYNAGTISTIENSKFVNNGSNESNKIISSGGALYNANNIDNIQTTTFENNIANSGGAIYNSSTLNNISNSNFECNNALSSGGAIYNASNLNSISETNFLKNSASVSGGAIYNASNLSLIADSNFIQNSSESYGGAIYHVSNEALNIQDTAFLSNSALKNGGAIYNENSTINISAIDNDVVFIGNVANNESNAIMNQSYMVIDSYDSESDYLSVSKAIINLNAGDKNIIINDGISGGLKVFDIGAYSKTISDNHEHSIININKTGINIQDELNNSSSAPIDGVVEINNVVNSNTLNLYNGKLKLGHHIYSQEESEILASQVGVGTIASNSALNIYGGNLSSEDNAIYHHSLGNMSLYNDLKMQVDADLAQEKMDTISATSFNNPSDFNIDINKINILAPTDKKELTLQFVEGMDNEANQKLSNAITYSGGEIVYSPIYKYKVEFNNQNGVFSFSNANNTNYNNVNPAIMSSSVAAQSGAIATQVATFGEAFFNMDAYMARDVNERIMMRDRNKYASAYSEGMLWDNAITRRNNREAWLRPYVTFESVPLKNGPKVDNIAYGTYFGTNSAIKQLKRGWDGALGMYIGYNGAKQKYDNTSVIQNGGTLGFVGELYKKNFFTGLTLNIGASAGNADTMYGKDNFNMLATGLASKTGYNIEFKGGKHILQPSLLLGYSFVNTFDFTNSAGVKISSDPIHDIHIEPGIRYILNLKNGWRPYFGVSMVWNVINKSRFYANNIALPETSIKPYVKYGAGVQKNWSEKCSSFAQTFITNGGRNGVGLQAGFSWLF